MLILLTPQLAAMLIEYSLDIVLTNVSFTNSNGSGLIMLNCGGNSVLVNYSNTSTNAKAGQSVVYTGGLHIELSTCGWKNLRMIGNKSVGVKMEQLYVTVPLDVILLTC